MNLMILIYLSAKLIDHISKVGIDTETFRKLF